MGRRHQAGRHRGAIVKQSTGGMERTWPNLLWSTRTCMSSRATCRSSTIRGTLPPTASPWSSCSRPWMRMAFTTPSSRRRVPGAITTTTPSPRCERTRGCAAPSSSSPPVERYILEAMKRDGVVGVRLPFIGLAELPDITTFDYRRFLRRLADLDWHVHLHVEGERLPALIDTIEASGVKLVIDHLGRPEPRAGINSDGFKAMLRSIERGRTWVKVSAGYRLGPAAPDYARELVRVAGPDRLVWASDCPFASRRCAIRTPLTG